VLYYIPNTILGISLFVDNDDPETSSAGQWADATAAKNHYGVNSLYATVGGNVDTYRFAPNITIEGQYDVYVWNSCFDNRHTAVPHRIVHADGETIVDLDQDCNSGSSGEWFLLGRYTFNVGTQGYLEISDQGLTWPSTTYIGADAVWFEEYDETPPSEDTDPPTVSITNPGDSDVITGTIDVSANATDNTGVVGVQFDINGAALGAEDTAAPYSVSLDTLTLNNGSHSLRAVARDSHGNISNSASVQITVNNNIQVSSFVDDFDTVDCSEVESLGPNYTINNESSLPVVGKRCGRYYAELTNNSDNITLHFNEDQGRLDALLVSFPFEYIARDIGIGTLGDPLTAPPAEDDFTYIFTGVQVHVLDLDVRNSSHVVVGHRGSSQYTIEGKNTLNGDSSVNDIGPNTVPDGRADIRIVGNADQSLTVYWQTPNPNPDSTADSWNLYKGTGDLPGTAPSYEAQVYVGLITYAFYTRGVPFVGTADKIEVIGEVTLDSTPVDVSTLQPSISVTQQSGGQSIVSFSYIRPAGSDDLNYTIEESSNLVFWESIGENNGSITINDNGNGTETVVWTASISAPNFMRVVVNGF
jgi:hypothetical protein